MSGDGGSRGRALTDTSRLIHAAVWQKPTQRCGFPGGSAGKESACNAGDPAGTPGLGRSPAEGIHYPLQYSRASLVAQTMKNPPSRGFDPWVGKIPCRRERLPTPVFLPGESPRTEEPGGLQSRGHKELDTTE